LPEPTPRRRATIPGAVTGGGPEERLRKVLKPIDLHADMPDVSGQ